MRAIAALTLWTAALCVPVVGQSAPKASTFRSSDGAFRFVYPADFQVCTRGNVDRCSRSYIPVCEPESFVCVVYPEEWFKNTNLGAESFQVREILTEREMMTADVCVTPYPQRNGDGVSDWPDFLISAEHPVELIGGIQFVHGVIGGVAAGHSSSADLYRVFHNQRCYELRVSQSWTNPNVYEPPMKTLTLDQARRFDQAMSLILHSFRFSD